MVETLLSSSQVLLFGLEMDDLQIVEPVVVPPGSRRAYLATTEKIDLSKFPSALDGRTLNNKKYFLLKDQGEKSIENGYYKKSGNKISAVYPPSSNRNNKGEIDERLPDRIDVYVRYGILNGREIFTIDPSYDEKGKLISVEIYQKNDTQNNKHSPFSGKRNGLASEIQQQVLIERDPSFARIYGFSFEGFYYTLPRPVIFLVHGDGFPVSELRGRINRARAPGEPSLTGIGEADFQFSDEITVWSYDKADYTIRMDVETGMFEDVLLAAMLGGSGGFDSAGMNARGMNARGMNARGMNARGMNARGMNARGGGNSD